MPGHAGPPSYPRTAHLPPVGVPVRDDLVLSDAEAARLLADEVIVEEKLDGANVTVWLDAVGVPQAATRGGPGALDRANQLGPLRGWIAAHGDELRALLAPGDVLYGEWLWWRHAVTYDALPDWHVGIDLADSAGRLAEVDERNRRLAGVSVPAPPTLGRGRFRGRSELEKCLGRSRFGPGPAEGLVVRSLAGRRVAKVVREEFVARSDEDWRRPERNRLAATAMV